MVKQLQTDAEWRNQENWYYNAQHKDENNDKTNLENWSPNGLVIDDRNMSRDCKSEKFETIFALRNS